MLFLPGLGLGDVAPISAEHGLGIELLYDMLEPHWKEWKDRERVAKQHAREAEEEAAIEDFAFVEQLPGGDSGSFVGTDTNRGVIAINSNVVTTQLEAAITKGIDRTKTGTCISKDRKLPSPRPPQDGRDGPIPWAVARPVVDPVLPPLELAVASGFLDF